MKKEKLQSFKPFVHASSRVLILGSMPGPEALRKREYYGYDHNAFWKIMRDLFSDGACYKEISYKEKLKLLQENRIAVWDVIASCTRIGASDSSIREVKPNNIARLVQKYKSIETIFLNGKTAEKLYIKYFKDKIHVPAYSLPSTSPAHASMSYAKKLETWAVIKKFVANKNPWC